jgi:hypothetical protein
MNEAYVTYHPYTAMTSTNILSCSNGLNGLQNKYGLVDINSIFPMVAAFSDAPWNSTNCGGCYRLHSRYTTTSIDVTVVDFLPPSNSSDFFDLSFEAFKVLFGDKGVHDGRAIADWEKISEGICQRTICRKKRK